MKLEIHAPSGIEVVDLDELSASYSGVVNIGQKCKHVWNTLPLEDETVDPFQCQLIGASGNYKLMHGQNRTECPKGLISPKLVPCNGCTGRCVNVRPGRPKYFQRNPAVPTLLNGNEVGEWGMPISEGDTISLGQVSICIKA
ncbi:MAG: hypothetical protein Q4B58_01325 [Bacteroidales bacterium]|nr:hypothetical protein [Bacteroidales bacterium]